MSFLKQSSSGSNKGWLPPGDGRAGATASYGITGAGAVRPVSALRFGTANTRSWIL